MAGIYRTDGQFGEYYGGGGLTESEQKVNVKYIYKYLSSKGWTLNAIAGLCGNIEYECHFGPGTEEVGGSGYGLIQWTPGTLHSKWCANNGYSDASSIDSQLAHIHDESVNGDSWYCKEEYTESYSEFSKSKRDPYYLAGAFAWNRERSAITLWGFHRGMKGDVGIDHTAYHVTPPHNRTYCKKSNYDSKCETDCKAYKYCYYVKYGDTKTKQQVLKNKNSTKKARGDAAIKWYNFLVESTFKGRTDYSVFGEDTNVDYLNLYKQPYWVEKNKDTVDGRKGLNYNTAIEAWTNAQTGWNNLVDGPNNTKVKPKDLIVGTNTVLPNCTSWVWGRLYEILGEEPFDFSGGDAGTWWNKAQTEAAKKAGYRTSDTPALGAIMCWQDKDNPSSMGHVAVVEKIFENGNITFSESGYHTWTFADTGFWNLQKNTTPTSWYTVARHNYVFKGYIHTPLNAIILPEIEYFELNGEPSTESANFKIKIKTNGSALDDVVCCLNGDESNLIKLELQTTDEEQLITITGLIPNTAYSIVVRIREPFGNVSSIPEDFITKQDYPDPIQNITISADTHHEKSIFTVNITPPKRWGYWKDKAKNDYGYRVFLVDNCLLSDYYDMKNENIQNFFKEKPADYLIEHAHNFQVGVSTWVTDHRIANVEDQKVFALEGHKEYPICSNSICLKELDEMSDNYYLLTKNIFSKPGINRLQAYDRKTGKPLNVFILKDL